MFKDLFKIALRSMVNRKTRTILTTLGIIIGITAIISLISVSQGLENAILDQFSEIGMDKIYVNAKGGGGIPGAGVSLTDDDLEAVERMAEIKLVMPYTMKSAEITYAKETEYDFLAGIPADKFYLLGENYGLDLKKGSWITSKDSFSAIIGPRVADDMFEKEISVKNSILIEGKKFRVKGILEEVGNAEDDSMIYIPLETLRRIFPDEKNKISIIDAQVKEGLYPKDVVPKVEKALERERDDDDFEVYTAENIIKQTQSILGIVEIVLSSIAAISLIVGGIGIMNSMYTSTLEKTSEIGIMKGIGARNMTIMKIFLIESSIMGLVGGALGSLFGTLIAKGVQAGAAAAGFSMMNVKISLPLIAFGIGFAVLTGAISGAIPAYRASKMSPVDALQYT